MSLVSFPPPSFRADTETGAFDPIDAAQRLAAPFTDAAFGIPAEDPEAFEALISDPVGVVVEAEPEVLVSPAGDRRAIELWWWKRVPTERSLFPCGRSTRTVKSQHELHFDAGDADLLANVDASIRSSESNAVAQPSSCRWHALRPALLPFPAPCP